MDLLNLADRETEPPESTENGIPSVQVSKPDSGTLKFTAVQPGLPAARNLAVSTLLHAAVFAALTLAHFEAPDPPKPDVTSTAPSTEIIIGDRLYYVTDIRNFLPQRRTPEGKRSAEAQAAKTDLPSPPPSESVAEILPAPPADTPPERGTQPAERFARVPRVFVPPEVRRSPSVPQTLIQPTSPPDLEPVDPTLPSFRVWTANLPRLTRAFVVPGRRTPPPPPNTPLPPPPVTLETLNVEPADSPIPSRLVLPAPPPPVFDEAQVKAVVSPPPLPKGDAADVLSISKRPLPVTDRVVVPPGNMVGRSGTGAVTTSDGLPGTGTRSVEPSMAGAGAKGTVAAGAAANDAGPLTVRTTVSPFTITRPSNGNFDAVLVQTAPLDQFPDGKNLLSGRPIYTVYLSMGTAKDWTLFFCIPGDKSLVSGADTRVVEINKDTPIRAPYPYQMVRPQISLAAYAKYVLVHGIVDDMGKFRDLRVVPPVTQQTGAALIASLNQWVFRPATRDGVPVTVEFLLSVPAAGL